MQALRTATLFKKGSNTSILLWILWIVQKPLFCVEDVWTAGCAILWRPFLTEHFQWLLLRVSGFQPAALLKKGSQQRRFSVTFAKFLRTSFYRTLPDDCFLCLPVILRSFSDHLFFRAPLGNSLFHIQVTEFQPPDKIKSISQALFKHVIRKRDVATRRRSFT